MAQLQVREQLVVEVADRLLPLLHLHYEESELARPVPLAPDWKHIFDYNSYGAYRALFLYHEDELIGYFSFFILPSIHTGKLVATHDILFVRKDWRIGRGALLLLRAADSIMQAAGAKEVFASHQGTAQLDKLMQHVGYACVGKQYYKQFVA